MVTVPAEMAKIKKMKQGSSLRIRETDEGFEYTAIDATKSKKSLLDFAGVLKTDKKITLEETLQYIKEGIYEERF